MADGNQGWWHSHYRWVIMVIVLVIAFGLIAAFGVWFRRRRDTKRGLQLYGNPVSGAGPLQSSGILSTVSGVLPSDQSQPPSQARSLPSNSVASSRTNVAHPRSVTPGSNNRLQKQSPAAAVNFRNVETRQVPSL
ncbi:uncharacterized protein N7503_009331 [Penicillium pulvis]|uniref:uncharacterized protein n=1 Tax=Penicillium pulvis TaxID=1562058 RepID=UPI002546C7AF|nr:uncharacterized protein N7503_009331 [Penicillium pulvis]KAJ5793353.1 hypothetical protein N7503_009331 [Penicillium pulvis]